MYPGAYMQVLSIHVHNYEAYIAYLAEFLKTCVETAQNIRKARFLVTAVRIHIGGLLSWLVSLSSSVPALTRHEVGRGLHVNS